MNRLTPADFERFAPLPGVVSAEERAELYRMSDAIQGELRNEREAHAHLCSRCESAFTQCVTPQACAVAERASGSREIPRWLLAALLVIAIAAVTVFAPGANAAPINCQGDQEYYWQVAAEVPNGAATWWTDCGYRYELPAASIVPPIIDVPAAPVPEPSTWALFAAGFAAVCAIVSRRNRKKKS